MSGADRAVAGPHGPWRIFAAIAATVAFPVPTSRAVFLMPVPAARRPVQPPPVPPRVWSPERPPASGALPARPGDARGDAFLNDRGSLSIGPAPEIDLAA